MKYEFTITQKERLTELGVPTSVIDVSESESAAERDKAFRELEKKWVALSRKKLDYLLENDHKTASLEIVSDLSAWLQSEGFTRVETPTMIPLELLDKMTVTEDEPLREQIYRVDRNKCLRPMLAPGLYILMRELRRITKKNIKIFEVGSCFRRETQGSRHLSEFTMLNMVEYGDVADGSQVEKLHTYAKAAMKAAGIDSYELTKESSAVYGETIDIEKEGLEIASASYGPHSLDPNWGVFEPWIGIGFGIERIALAKRGGENIKRYSHSTNYLSGYSLHV